MANRMISYGYGIVDGKLCVIPKETEIIREIFKLYINGDYLQQIAEKLMRQGIEFYDGNYLWNKNKVSRILENNKYVGENGYPSIINLEDFYRAAEKRKEKSYEPARCSNEIEHLRKVVYCQQCGARIHRRSKWGIREKWFCPNGCKVDKYISDVEILGGILKIAHQASQNTTLLLSDLEHTYYTRTPEIMRYSNEISRLMNERNPTFSAGKKLILNCASIKFRACEENTQVAYTDFIVQMTKEAVDNDFISAGYFQKVISKVLLDRKGDIFVRFLNGVEISSSSVNGDKYATEQKNCN